MMPLFLAVHLYCSWSQNQSRTRTLEIPGWWLWSKPGTHGIVLMDSELMANLRGNCAPLPVIYRCIDIAIQLCKVGSGKEWKEAAIPLGDQVWINGSRSKETLGKRSSTATGEGWMFQVFTSQLGGFNTSMMPELSLNSFWQFDWIGLCMFMYVYMYVYVASSFKFPELADFPDRLWIFQLHELENPPILRCFSQNPPFSSGIAQLDLPHWPGLLQHVPTCRNYRSMIAREGFNESLNHIFYLE